MAQWLLETDGCSLLIESAPKFLQGCAGRKPVVPCQRSNRNKSASPIQYTDRRFVGTFDSPANASSGSTRRSIPSSSPSLSCLISKASARLKLAATSPSLGEYCKVAIFMLKSLSAIHDRGCSFLDTGWSCLWTVRSELSERATKCQDPEDINVVAEAFRAGGNVLRSSKPTWPAGMRLKDGYGYRIN